MKHTATHLGFPVSDLRATKDFYTKFLGIEPAKDKKDYIKFELREPSMIISFFKANEKLDLLWKNTGAHFGLRFESDVNVAERLKSIQAAGIETLVEESVTCCYAVQNKFWVQDPDGIRWEVYSFIEDSDKLKNPAGAASCGCVSQEESEGQAACC